MLGDDVRGLAQFDGRLKLAFGGDYFRTALPFCLRFFGHRSLHVVGKRDVFYLNDWYFRAPRARMSVNNVFNLLIYHRSFRKQLIQAELPDHIADGSLADLVRGLIHILYRDDRFLGIRNAVVCDGSYVNGNVVFCNYFLRSDLHGDEKVNEYRYEYVRQIHTVIISRYQNDGKALA